MIVSIIAVTPVHASERKTCWLSPQVQVEFSGRLIAYEKIGLGKYEKHHSGRVRDSFAYAFGFTIRDQKGGKLGPQHEMFFRDEEPKCNALVMHDQRIFYLSRTSVYRRMDSEGQRGGNVLVVSEDGGRHFSDNIFPSARNAWNSEAEISEQRAAIESFGYHQARVDFDGKLVRLELTNPLDYQQFLYFESTDFGKHWQRHAISTKPQVYTVEEVEKWREMYARDRYINMRFRAKQESCGRTLRDSCVKAVDDAWEQSMQACTSKSNWQTCVKNFVPPAVPSATVPVK
ncbi:hypothetical protein RF679_04415 [Undibacterium cyanobacteriorum]|uniref:Uncharacterized protein n=1 Tax=Undibacterium cyanobacteriorum TaxID=3073561 RepID=A0ABY9RL18_9BURK|nr:hypothetical protein [Undibacterium sp. 20NA77.5]WMW81529.1 hypothetical protein RF679_04415 [Undibacterium sp. 20NA77.5]